MKNLKKLTLLHSNDMHGDFLAEEVDDNLVGGVSMLSGYVNKVRNEEKNTLYCIAGDMFRGSVIDSEFQGLSTIEIMNIGLIIAIIGTLAIIILAIAIMLGKADLTMIDYYFSSPEKRAQYNVQRLRLLTGGTLIFIIALEWILPFVITADAASLIALIVVIALYKLLESTWTRAK